MEKIIDADFRVTWKTPVYIRIGDGMRERIDGPNAALAALLHRWPSTNHREFGIAKRRCVEAIARRQSAELARSTFVEAALAVKVFA
ncbi:Protein of unknown function (DUF982) [Rhizobium leguminosarum bv. trifolii WSM2297]|uniref:DUF982 domain-containing protein n=1 Tax=Rhizobium leguminosarum bv. trifolii WSM2297 TaxID=754762 RepID=J0WHZ0_RHILT|nr:DUF982 domain-containing protein [Rhizobium leguminosarum]EJC83322.1 Protein of unknown function (DUF982) [Rhizobium leguminosarum bv. trifolii WSM2297]EJC85083.1 Protein of unknown function (DUF982) [Rhizobium leguminosarum bv. trifolii WSM2297]